MATKVRTGSGSSCWDTDTRARSQLSGIPENLRHTLYGLIRLGVTPVKVREHLGCTESIHLAPQALDAVETNSYTGYAAPLYCLPFFAVYVACPSVFGNGTVYCLGRDGIGRVGRFAATVINGRDSSGVRDRCRADSQLAARATSRGSLRCIRRRPHDL
jgi:hypothetical protein